MKDGQSSIPSTETLNFEQLANELLEQLKPRPKEILVRRFGLDGKEPQVLDRIGKDFGITRERVRQIERDSFKKLHQMKKVGGFEMILQRTLDIISANGGFCDRLVLKKNIKSSISAIEKNQLMFILNSFNELSYNKGSLTVAGFWFLKDQIKGEQVMQIHDFIIRYFREQRKPCLFKDLKQYLQDSVWNKFFRGERSEDRLSMLLSLSRIIEKNIMGELGLKNWRLISQRGTREKAFLVLRKYVKPLHFTEITGLINKHWDKKIALPQTVHNELIKDKRFVLVGRGMYGLRDWGFDEGTVKEIIIKLLKEAQTALEKDAIIDHVLTKKRVKKTTVMVNLADRRVFHKDEAGHFVLKIAEIQ